ncbi:hypothetical protein PR048_017642 [Dryococelus australis]|uniref:Uncharacterized protein n=1 Tax=Dryococelus australis TaxID=614101 RepID=A0ABQ9HA52_9NEOP|nr:hypothetical protein PR048_017642 [Dryococelus australis]
MQKAEQNRKRLLFIYGLNLDTFAEGYSYFYKQLSSNLRERSEVDVVQLLFAMKINVEAEFFFRKYDLIVTDKKNRMSVQTGETCSLLSFNSIDGF